MIDQGTPRGRMLVAALDVAAKKDWADITLLDVADGAGLSLSDLRNEFKSKTDIIVALLRAVDDDVLKRAPKRGGGQEKRDLLFDVVMTRFDVLAPYKTALKSIYASGAADFSLAGPYLASQHWMLQAAGIDTDGAGGALRMVGLGMTYASVFRVWLEDDDAGLARTMAALDRRLRRGERAVRTVDQIASTLQRFATDAPGFLRSVMRGRNRKPDPAPDPQTGTI